MSSAESPEKPAHGARRPLRATFRQRLEFVGLSLAVKLVGLLPFWALRRLAFAFGSLFYALDRQGRGVARANLDAAFGDQFSSAQKAVIARRSYQSFARTMLELLWSPNLTPETLEAIRKVEGLEEPFHKDPNQPVIYVCLHSSNFEWLSQSLACVIGPGIVVAQRMKNPLLGPIFDRLRASTGHIIIPQERAMIRMLQHLRAGGYFNVVVDLNLDPNEASVIIDEFDGLMTCTTQIHAALALRTGARIVPAECRPLPDGTYRLIHHPPLAYPATATAAEIAQLCWNVLESSIRENPECWLWAYKHWRFKPSSDPSAARYPFYANTAPRFDRKLRSQAAVETGK